jgi:hypothetical protein
VVSVYSTDKELRGLAQWMQNAYLDGWSRATACQHRGRLREATPDVVPAVVEFEVAVPCLTPALR